MAGPTVTYEGDVISSALSTDEAPDAHKELSENFRLEQGQVVAVYNIDTSDNTRVGKATQTVYDVSVVRPSGATEIIRRCPLVQPGFGGGVNNFFEAVMTDPKADAQKDTEKPLKRGHLVLLGYISGSKSSPVILGTLPHAHKAAIARRPKKAKGVHTEGEIQGLNFMVTNEGSLKIIFNGPRDDEGKIVGKDGPTAIEIDKTGNIIVTTNAKQTVKIDRVGKKIRVDNGPTYIDMDQEGDKIQVVAKIVEVGTGGLQPQVVGDDWKSMMEELITEITKIYVPTGVGPSGTPINTPKFMAIKAKLKECLSKNHKVEK
jgi:hypothetical protein